LSLYLIALLAPAEMPDGTMIAAVGEAYTIVQGRLAQG
jgi:hypothetical protein